MNSRATARVGLGGPLVSGDTVVWVDCRLCVKASGLPGFRGTGIYSERLPWGSARLLSPPGQDPYAPAVAGNTAVWVGYHGRNSDIYGKNLATGRLLRVSTHGTAMDPATSGSIVVWQDRRSGDWDIYGKDLRTGHDFVVARHNGRGNYLENPAISGRTVVWTSWRADHSVAIVGEYLSTRRRFTVSVIRANHFNPQLGPTVAISGQFVVWDLARNSATSSRPLYEIVGEDIATLRTIVIADSGENLTTPAISGATVVWETSKEICGTHLTSVTATNP